MNTDFFANIDRITSEATAAINDQRTRPAKKPIYVNVVFHKDLGYPAEQEFEKTHLALAKKHIENISGREVIVNVIRDAKMRNFNYQSDNDVEYGLRKHYDRNKNPDQAHHSGKPKIEKTLFVTPEHLSFSEPGRTDPCHEYGIASYNNARGAAHTLGLLLGATRADGEITYNGWWNDTFMKYNNESPLRGNDLTYSDANKQNIRTYLAKFD